MPRSLASELYSRKVALLAHQRQPLQHQRELRTGRRPSVDAVSSTRSALERPHWSAVVLAVTASASHLIRPASVIIVRRNARQAGERLCRDGGSRGDDRWPGPAVQRGRSVVVAGPEHQEPGLKQCWPRSDWCRRALKGPIEPRAAIGQTLGSPSKTERRDRHPQRVVRATRVQATSASPPADRRRRALRTSNSAASPGPPAEPVVVP